MYTKREAMETCSIAGIMYRLIPCFMLTEYYRSSGLGLESVAARLLRISLSKPSFSMSMLSLSAYSLRSVSATTAGAC